MLTEVASSIIAASLPISHGPKLSPRSQLRSMVVVMMIGPLVSGSSGLSVRPNDVRRRCDVPGRGIDGADGVAGDIGIMQRLDVEIKAFDVAQPVGQGAQQFPEFAQLGLRL